MFATKMAAVAVTIAVALAQTATAQNAQNCFEDFALAASLASKPNGVCGAVQRLVKCTAGADRATRDAARQVAASHKCATTGAGAAPTLTASNNHVNRAVSEGSDMTFYRFKRETTTIASLTEGVAELEKTKADQADVDSKLKSLESTTASKLAGLTASVGKTTKDLTADLATQAGAVDKSVKGSLLALNGKIDKLSKDLDALLTKQIKGADDAITKSLKTVADKLDKLVEVSGDCNYATHFKDAKTKKCVQFKDCSLPTSTYTSTDGKHHDFLSKGSKAFPSFIWQHGTKDKDHVCGTASWRRWYGLSTHVYFHVVPWPKWMYPNYGEAALINVCRLAGLRPWRDQGSWSCDPGDYVCDNWGYNLGGHDLMNKFRCVLHGQNCAGHSGDKLVNKAQMGEDLVNMGFAKGTDDIAIVTKYAHSDFAENTANYLTVQIESNGALKYKSGYANGQPKDMGKAVAVCAMGYN